MKKKTLNQIKKELKELKYKRRDKNIQRHIRREISLSTRKIKSKKKYTRKVKYKNNNFTKLI